jgi:hypothetical protein
MMFLNCPADLDQERSALRAFAGATGRTARRPNSAPAYYLGHPARLWITVMPSRRTATAPWPAIGAQAS